MAKTYSLGARCITEAIGTAFGVYAGETAIANALLPSAKGQGMGFGWIAVCYGLAFFFPSLFFGHISAILNPAFCLALVVTGDLTGREFFALSAAEIVGAFIGGVLVWIHWIPHFKTVPEPPPDTARDVLLHKPDCASIDCVQIASYQTHPKRQASNHQRFSWKGVLADMVYYVWKHDKYSAPKLVNSKDADAHSSSPHSGLHCHLSVLHTQLQDQALNRRLEELLCMACHDTLANTPELAELASNLSIDVLQTPGKLPDVSDGLGHGSGCSVRESNNTRNIELVCTKPDSLQQLVNNAMHDHQGVRQSADVSLRRSTSIPSPTQECDGGPGQSLSSARVLGLVDNERRKVALLYQAALVADQNMKLSVFATRPAIYAPVFNFIVEFLGTLMLVVGIKLLEERNKVLHPSAMGDTYMATIEPYYVGLYLVVMILGIGGPTGFAVNPARDFGPRLAHALLPIPNKGPSEWHYGWIPVVAPLLGGPAGAALFLLLKQLN